MSRISVVTATFVASLIYFLPVPMPLTLHGHPQKQTYASDAEWPLISAQGHWSPANNPAVEGHTHIGHTHVEVWAPIYAELPHQPFTLHGRIQLFHVTGRVWGVFAWMGQSLTWDAPGLPIEGDPHGVVIRNFTLTIDPSMDYPNGSGGSNLKIPENGWYHVRIDAFTKFDGDGTQTGTSLILPFYAKGDPAVPESSSDYALSGFYFTLAAKTSAASVNGNFHGEPASEYRDTYAPVGTLTGPLTVPALTWSYARVGTWPASGLDRMKVIVDPDLHNGIPGTTVVDIPGDQFALTDADVVFDPSTLGPGLHKVAVVWEQGSGPGDAAQGIKPDEILNSLLVTTVMVGDVPPTPGDPVDCAGSYGPWLEISPGLWRKEFTVTQQPANGGKSCAVVVNGG